MHTNTVKIQKLNIKTLLKIISLGKADSNNKQTVQTLLQII